MPTWREFFDSTAETYDENPFTFHAAEEAQFLLNLYPVPPGSRILDVGCGTGRHAIEFARLGHRVTGVDFSEGMLRVARAKAAVEGLEIEWVHADARDFALGRRFDYAVCLCEGGVGIVERGEDAEAHDRAIFANVARHLEPAAPFVVTALNGYAAIRQMTDEHVSGGAFDPATMVSFYEDEWELPDGVRKMTIYERLFVPPEVVRMLEEAGFAVDNVYGGTAGAWAQRPLRLDEVEAMYLGRLRYDAVSRP